MNRFALLVIAALWALVGVLNFADPRRFYASTPGLVMMGPYNVHFIRDAGLAFLAGGGVTIVGAWRHDRRLALAGVSWPCLHALFHLQIWVHRGFPFDRIAAFEAIAVVGPAVLAAVLAWGLPVLASHQLETAR